MSAPIEKQVKRKKLAVKSNSECVKKKVNLLLLIPTSNDTISTYICINNYAQHKDIKSLYTIQEACMRYNTRA